MAFISQISAHLVSVSLILLAPRLLTVEQYGAIQLLILYLSFVGMLHLGLNDGIFLRLGGRTIAELKNEYIARKFVILIAFNTATAALLIITTILFEIPQPQRTILIIASICIPLVNGAGFLGFVHQATGMGYIYTRSVILEKTTSLLLIFALITIRPQEIIFYLLWVPLAMIFPMVYLVSQSQRIPHSSLTPLSMVLKATADDVRLGAQVMVSNIAGSLIVGSNLFIIERYYGVREFGKVALATTMATFTIAFVLQAGAVLSPMVRRMGLATQTALFEQMGRALTPLLLALLLLYYPLSSFISYWMPQYDDSKNYLVGLLPLVVFEGKMTLLYSTFMRNYHKQKALLIINLCTALCAAVLAVVVAETFHSTTLVPFAILLCFILRAISTEYYLAALMGVRKGNCLAYDLLGVTLFIVFSQKAGPAAGFLVVLVLVGLYLLRFYRSILNTARLLYST